MAKTKTRAKQKKGSVSAKQYMAVLRKMARHKKRKGSFKAWIGLAKRAAHMRKRMIAANFGRHKSVPLVKSPKSALAKMPPEFRKMYQWITASKDGKKVDRGFREFWNLPFPPEIKMVPGGPKDKVIPLMGMGECPEVHLSTENKGGGGKRTVIKGKWKIGTDASRKHLFILGNRPEKKPYKFVGYAPETNYIPSKDIEEQLTKMLKSGRLTKDQAAKLGKWWRHIHGENDSDKQVPESRLKWPAMYADRNGKVDKDSNFISDKTPTFKVRDWQYGN